MRARQQIRQLETTAVPTSVELSSKHAPQLPYLLEVNHANGLCDHKQHQDDYLVPTDTGTPSRQHAPTALALHILRTMVQQRRLRHRRHQPSVRRGRRM